MTAKAFLSQAYQIDLQINSKLEQVQSLRVLAAKATATLSHSPMSASPNTHRMEDTIVKLVDLESEINADIGRLIEIKRTIMETIQRIEATEHKTLLGLRYICGKTWEEIAAEMFYSVRNMHIIHGAALREVGKLRAAL